jgi:hypothetical protein
MAWCAALMHISYIELEMTENLLLLIVSCMLFIIIIIIIIIIINSIIWNLIINPALNL